MPGLTPTRTALIALALASAAALTAAMLVRAAPPSVTVPEHGTLTTLSGMPIDVTYTKATRALTASVTLRDGRHVTLADGTYALTNGGAIRVRGGRIVWDAFGVVEKLNRGIPVSQLGSTGE